MNLAAGNLELASNPFYRQFTDVIPVSPAAAALPVVRASGWVRDMGEALSLGTAASAGLLADMQAFAAGTRDQQLSLMTSLVHNWAMTSGRVLGGEFIAMKQTVLAEGATHRTIRLTPMDPAEIPNASEVLVPCTWLKFPPEYYYTDVVAGVAVQLLNAAGREVLRKLGDAEVFDGLRFTSFNVVEPIPTAGGGAGGGGGGGGGGGAAQTVGYQTRWVVNISAQQISLINEAYQQLVDSVYPALVLQTRLAPYLDAVGITLDAVGIQFNAAPLEAKLEAKKTTDPKGALADLVELNRFATSDLQAFGVDGMAKLRSWIDGLAANSPLRTDLSAMGVLAGLPATGTSRADFYFGDSTGNVFAAGGGHDLIDGDAGIDVLAGNDGDDYLWGRTGDDRLDGGTGSDVLEGGTGADILTGGLGNDTFIFGRGDGQDVIQFVQDSNSGRVNTIRFKPGVSPDDIRLRQVYDATLGGATGALEVSIIGTTDKVTVVGFFYGDDTSNLYGEVQQLQFANGTIWSAEQIKAMLFQGTSGNDVVRGTSEANVLSGGVGDDTQYGAAGDDTIDGGDGNDALWGEIGNDSLVGGAGNDKLDGSVGDDTFDGGVGNDTLTGGTGNNRFLFGRGDGQDVVQFSQDTTAGKLSTLELKSGVLPTDVILRQVYDGALGGATGALEMSIAGTSDKVAIVGFFYGDSPANLYNGVQQIRFADHTTWDMAAITAKLHAGTSGNDTVRGSPAADTMTGGVGNDSLNGAAGNDSLVGGDGNDTLTGEAGNDVVDGGLGNDIAYGGEGIDTLSGAAGNDTLDGGAGDDLLEGGAGSDVLIGGSGNNTFSFGKGDGQDIVQYSYDATAGKLSTILLRTGIAPSEVQIRQVYDSTLGGATGALELAIAGTTDKITINGYFYGGDPANPYNGVQQIKFTDGGTIWNWATIKSKLFAGTSGNDIVRGTPGGETLSGAAGADTLYGGDGNDTLDGAIGNDALFGEIGNDSLNGGDGNDSLDGSTGDDTLEGGLGNDILVGGTGNNTYKFGKGDGQDLIQYSQDSTAGKLSTLLLKTGIAPSEVLLRQVPDSTLGGAAGALEISIAGTTDKLLVNGFFYGDNPVNSYNGVQQIKFIDGGTIWNWATIKSKLYAGTAGNDVTRGSTAADSISGGAGADTLNGAAGDDTLDGGIGNDILYGEIGDDTLRGADGNDTLDGSTGKDNLDGGLGSDTLVGGTGNNTYQFGKGDGQDLIQYSQDSTAGKLSTLLLKTGIASSEVVLRQVPDSSLGGAAGALEISIAGTTDKVVVNGFFYGDDPVNSYNGVQQIKFTDGGTIWNWATIKSKLYAGTAGNDVTRGSTAADSILGGAGADTLNGAAGDDTLDGGVGNDVLYGEIGNDTIKGGDGSDSLNGSAGNDSLDGGLGNDALVGGTGNNSYQFGRGDGQDLIQYSQDATPGKLSTFQFKAGVAPTDVQLRKVADASLGGATGALEISISGTTDKVVVNGFFYGNNPVNLYNGVQQIKFSDGVTWDLATIVAKASGGSPAGAPTGRIESLNQRKQHHGDGAMVELAGRDPKIGTHDRPRMDTHLFQRFESSHGRTLLDSKVHGLVSAMAAFSPPASTHSHLPPTAGASVLNIAASDWAP